MSKNGENIKLSTKWARGVLKSMNWVKRRGTTAKTHMNPALYEELTFNWKKKIASIRSIRESYTQGNGIEL